MVQENKNLIQESKEIMVKNNKLIVGQTDKVTKDIKEDFQKYFVNETMGKLRQRHCNTRCGTKTF